MYNSLGVTRALARTTLFNVHLQQKSQNKKRKQTSKKNHQEYLAQKRFDLIEQCCTEYGLVFVIFVEKALQIGINYAWFAIDFSSMQFCQWISVQI
jgi:hypothetical protein